LTRREVSVAYYKGDPKWDNSRNVANYGRKLYPVSASTLKHFGAIYPMGTPNADGAGGYTYTSAKRDDAWMSVILLRAEQIFAYRGKNIKATHMIKMRYEIYIEESDHILLDGVTYEVIYVDSDRDRGLFKTAMCTELR
jgi:SPP1 family predicted phage head-tail adaptor